MMIVATAPKAHPSIKSMSERHHEIKRRLVAGDRPVDIAKSLGVTQSWLSVVMSSPAFKVEMERERNLADVNAADIGKRLTRLAPDAMTVLEKAVRGMRQADGTFKMPDGLSPMNQAKLAQDVLDRAGHGAPKDTKVTADVTVQIVQFNMNTQQPGQKKEVVIEGRKEAECALQESL